MNAVRHVRTIRSTLLTRTARTGDSRQEAGGFTEVTLSLIVRQQLKGLTLCLHGTLQKRTNKLYIHNIYTHQGSSTGNIRIVYNI